MQRILADTMLFVKRIEQLDEARSDSSYCVILSLKRGGVKYRSAVSATMPAGPLAVTIVEHVPLTPLSQESYSLSMSSKTASRLSASKAKQTGMGAILHERGVGFRVWAPHADLVSVVGDFNDWSPVAHPMLLEKSGCWFRDIADAAVGDEYRYYIVNGEQELWRIDPYARELTHCTGNAVVHNPYFDWTGDSFHTPPLNELVIYELDVGTFAGANEGRPGTFRNVVDRLDYLSSLGINAIQLLPVTAFSAEQSRGFHPSHLFAVENSYGGPHALKELVKQAHQEGLCILLDVIYNHLGPRDVSLWQFDGWCKDDLGGIYFYNDWKGETPWGCTRPDYGREEVRRYLHDNALMWIEEYHFDGLRIDGTSYVRSVDGQLSDGRRISEGCDLLSWINEDLLKVHPGRICIAEGPQDDPSITKSPRDGGAGFSAQWDYDFMYRLRECVQAASDDDRFLEEVGTALQRRLTGDAFKRVVFTECDDKAASGLSRVPSEIFPETPESWWSRKRSTLAAGILFTAPGIPMLFQGQEFVQTGLLADPQPLDWQRSERFAGIVQLYRDLIHLRLNREGQTRGLCGQGIDCFHIDKERKLIAYRRWERGGPLDDVLVVANFSHESRMDYPLGMPVKGSWKLRLNTDAKVYCDDFWDVGSGDLLVQKTPYRRLPFHVVLSIGPYSMQIYSHESMATSERNETGPCARYGP
jgi:1,4-alpha-glucan branching enzyme